VLSEFGRAVGVPNLAFDPNHHCTLASASVELEIQHKPHADELLLAAVVGKVPPDPTPECLAGLLELSLARALQRNGTLGIDRSAGTIVYVDRCKVGGLSSKTLERRIRSLIAAVEAWREFLTWSERNASTPTEMPAYENLIRA